jgi:hypothetical protein
MAVEKIEKETLLERWLEQRSYGHEQFADLDCLAKRKRELSVAVTAVLPGRRAIRSVAGLSIDRARAEVMERSPIAGVL